MQPFTVLTAVAAPYDRLNVDTDQILPARYLLKRRTDPEYPTYLFHDLRFSSDGTERSDFVLNQPPYRNAKIFVGNSNFGGGSSREAAAIAFDRYGVRCVIAPNFGDIFYNNCVKNGILPMRLPENIVESIRSQLHARPGATLTVDLPAQTLTDVQGRLHLFAIDGFSKSCLVEGLSQIDLTLRRLDLIEAFERRYRETHSWA
ncbi:MAG: 3-isopropylmalate dehydratase small subunit [Betaproteobacteria bacterium]|nr:MAG: 3-isopropylmalate dehydratase small subunit [Betaproteobacteria bacterium]